MSPAYEKKEAALARSCGVGTPMRRWLGYDCHGEAEEIAPRCFRLQDVSCPSQPPSNAILTAILPVCLPCLIATAWFRPISRPTAFCRFSRRPARTAVAT